MDLSKIGATLRHGRVVTGKRWKAFKISFAVMALCIVLWLTMTIVLPIIHIKHDMDSEIFFTLIGGSVLFVILFCIILWLLKINIEARKEVSLWLQDAIELEANTKRMDVVSLDYKPHQIQVKFEYNGNKHQKLSVAGSILTGYHKVFDKYADRKITILYSPKFDEVILLKA